MGSGDRRMSLATITIGHPLLPYEAIVLCKPTLDKRMHGGCDIRQGVQRPFTRLLGPRQKDSWHRLLAGC